MGLPDDDAESSVSRVRIARIYDTDLAGETGRRVLVDRLWPRGVARANAQIDEWCKAVAPSTDLRKWYGHVPERFGEFAVRYRRELQDGVAAQALTELRRTDGPLVLITATRDVEHSATAVLRDLLRG